MMTILFWIALGVCFGGMAGCIAAIRGDARATTREQSAHADRVRQRSLWTMTFAMIVATVLLLCGGVL